MKVHRNDIIAPREVSSIHDTYKEDTELGDSLTAKSGSNSPRIPDDDAATAAIQHPLRDETAEIQQGLPLTAAETSVMKKITAQDLGVLEKLKEMMEILNSSDHEKKIVAQDLGVLKKLKEMMEILNSSDHEKKNFAEDSELLEKLKEIIKRINTSEWSLTGIRELIDEFSTTTQFDLHGIHNVEKNMKDQNLNLEIGEFSLVRVMEKARKALHGKANTGSGAAAGILDLLKKQEADEKESTMQAATEGSGGNTHNTPDSDDSADYNLLNIEA